MDKNGQNYVSEINPESKLDKNGQNYVGEMGYICKNSRRKHSSPYKEDAENPENRVG